MQNVRRILTYLKATPSKGILFKTGTKINVQGFIDVDYGGFIVDRRSTTRYYVFLGGNLVFWRCKKQNVITRSSTEVEFRAMALDLCELLWL